MEKENGAQSEGCNYTEGAVSFGLFYHDCDDEEKDGNADVGHHSVGIIVRCKNSGQDTVDNKA
jgi:hypothetical protein